MKNNASILLSAFIAVAVIIVLTTALTPNITLVKIRNHIKILEAHGSALGALQTAKDFLIRTHDIATFTCTESPCQFLSTDVPYNLIYNKSTLWWKNHGFKLTSLNLPNNQASNWYLIKKIAMNNGYVFKILASGTDHTGKTVHSLQGYYFLVIRK